MSNRNYRAMGATKLRACYEDLANQPAEDRDVIVSLAVTKGIVDPVAQTAYERRAVIDKVVDREMPNGTLFDSTVFKPMLAFDAGRPVVVPVGEEWVLEPKYDGIRFLVHVSASGVRCYGGRNGADHTGNAPNVERALAHLPRDTVFDGELVTAEGRSGDTMSSLASRDGSLRFVVFDLIRLAGEDVRGQRFGERRALLGALNDYGLFDDKNVGLAPQFESTQEQFEKFVHAGWEGLVAKRLDGFYRSGKRSRDMLKLKPDSTIEAVVTSFVMGKGESNRDRVGAIEFRILDSGVKSTCGYDCELPEIDAILGKTIEVAHMGLFEKTGKPRHPRFRRMRPDRDAVTS